MMGGWVTDLGLVITPMPGLAETSSARVKGLHLTRDKELDLGPEPVSNILLPLSSIP